MSMPTSMNDPLHTSPEEGGSPAISMTARRTLDASGIVRSYPVITKVFMRTKELFPHLKSLRIVHVAIGTDTITLALAEMIHPDEASFACRPVRMASRSSSNPAAW